METKKIVLADATEELETKKGKRWSKKQILTWGLSGLVTFIFLGSGIFKLTGGDATLLMAQLVGGANNLTLLAYLEFLIVALFLIPRTAIIGAMMMVAYMGGAVAALFVQNQSVLPPVILEIIIWIAVFIRFQELTGRE